MDKKGFTLIELIAVIVILGMLLMIVMPATSRIMASNDTREYEEYYKLIKYAAYKYARGRQQDLGGVQNSGCIESGINLDTFIYDGLLKPFSKNEEDVKCMVPSESNLLENKTRYYDIRIINDKGTITVKHSLVCERGGRIVYQKLYEKDGTQCKKYEGAKVTDLYAHLSKTESGASLQAADSQGNRFIGTSTKNYVKYAGKLWRIVSVNTTERNVKIVSDEILTYINYNETTDSNYNNSNVEEWINTVLKNGLRNPYVFLMNSKWNFRTLTSASMPAYGSAVETQNIAGLLNLYEYTKVKSYIGEKNSKEYYLMTPYDSTNIWYVNSSNNAATITPKSFKGIRPALVLRTGVTFQQGGTGESNNPYIIIGEQNGLAGDKINTRYPGEYVQFDGMKYRIIETSSNGTKLLGSGLTPGLSGYFDNTNIYQFSTSALSGTNLNNNYYNSTTYIKTKSSIERHEYCSRQYIESTTFTTSCKAVDKKSGFFSLPAIGDFYTVPTTENYWTSSYNVETTVAGMYKDPLVQMMTPTGVSPSGIRTNGAYYPVIVISPSITITSGDGTYSSPYVVS